MKLNFFHKITKPLNYIVPKTNRIYAVPLTNCRKDCYDLLNYGSDNLLCVIRNLYENYYELNTIIYLECFSEGRMGVIQDYLDSNKKGPLRIVLVKSHITVENPKFSFKQAMKNTLLRFRCKIWLADTGHVNFYEKVFSQKYYVMNYSTPFKKEEGIDKKHNFLNIDGYVHTSELCAHYLSAEYIADYHNSLILGFARNDTLFDSDKEYLVKKWLECKTEIKWEKIIIYAPTYREYEGAFSEGVLGYDDPQGEIDKFLEENNCILVVKMHPKQPICNIKMGNRVFLYETNYQFSLYDVMSVSDLLITDYSSLMHDYCLTGKKVVLNWFDYEKYDNTRGFCFEPIEYYAPGPIAKDLKSLLNILYEQINSKGLSEQENRIRKLFFKYIDNNSTERITQFMIKQMKEIGIK